MAGYDLALVERVARAVDIPVIASGGAGSYQHMVDVVQQAGASAVAAASIFHFTELTPAGAKTAMQAAGIPVQADFEAFQRASDLMGVQRHLKVIGIFARICHRDGKPKYLGDVPRFFSYIEAVLARRPELAELGELFASLAKDEGARA